MKKIVFALVIIIVLGGAYVYFDAQKTPQDIQVVTGDKVAESESSIEPVELGSPDGFYALASGSVLERKGSASRMTHTGTINFQTGGLDIENGIISDGSFVIDMTSISPSTTSDPLLKEHLQDNLFHVKDYPISSFVLHAFVQHNTETMLMGDLSIAGHTQGISIPASIQEGEGGILQVFAQFAIDRKQWNLDAYEGVINNYLQFVLNVKLLKTN